MDLQYLQRRHFILTPERKLIYSVVKNNPLAYQTTYYISSIRMYTIIHDYKNTTAPNLECGLL